MSMDLTVGSSERVDGTVSLGQRPQATWRRVLAQRRTQLGITCAAIPVLIALFGPALAPHSPTLVLGRAFDGPGPGHLLGTDYLGRDVLSRLLNGGRSVLWMSVAATTIGMIAGVTLGMIAGYSRDAADNAIMRCLDIVMAFPNVVLVLLVVAMLGTHSLLVVCLVGVAWTPPIARVTRGVTLTIVRQDFVAAAEVAGMPRRRILFREVLPNLVTPLMVEYGLRLTWSIGLIAAVSFLGYGIQPPNADWGLMINENRVGLTQAPLATLAPIACIALFTIGTNLITDGIARAVAGIGHKRAER
jgi:peptide/nickel transport system permease protein